MKKITIIFISVLMIFASCSTSTSYDDKEIEEKTNTEVVEDEPKEDNHEQEIDYRETSLDQDNAVVRPFSLGDPTEKQEPPEEVPLTKKERKALKKAEKRKAKEAKKHPVEEDGEQEEMTENEKNQSNGFVSGLLNVIIFILILVFLGLCGLYVKQFLL